MLRSLLVMLCWVGCVWEVPNVLGIEAIAATKPITVSIQMNMTEHSAALLNWQHAHNIKSVWGQKVWIPFLDVYSPSGQLIYHGEHTDAQRALEVLKALPKTEGTPPHAELHMTLPEVLDLSPDLKRLKAPILENHHYVVVSTSLFKADGGSNSAIQDTALNELKKRVRTNIDIVQIYLVPPAE